MPNDLSGLINIASLVASIASLILAVVAIWLSFYVKGEADKINLRTLDLLIQIESDAKTVAQVALPELKAYGDSMRKFVLHGSNTATEPPVTESLRRIERQLNDLRSEPDITKLKKNLLNATDKLKESERVIERSRKKSDFVGVTVKIAENMSISTSSPQETWQDVINFINTNLSFKSDNYMDTWKLILQRTGDVIPKSLIEDKTATFDDAGVNYGDVLLLKRRDFESDGKTVVNLDKK